jgi:putrescine transport system permease protein
MVIFSKVRLGVSPDVNALATVMVLLVACGVVASSFWMRTIERRQARERAQAQVLG